jgi:hypothetical protein
VSVLDDDPIFFGELRAAPEDVWGHRVMKVLFKRGSSPFRIRDRRQDLDAALHQIRLHEALLNDYYRSYAILSAPAHHLAYRPLVLEPGRDFWVLGRWASFQLRSDASAGNWGESAQIKSAKAALGAQIYRLEALYLGATRRLDGPAASRRAEIHAFCAERIKPRLEGILRAAGSRSAGDTWEDYVGELREMFGAPLLRHLYGEPGGQRSRLEVGTRWQREGAQHPLAGELGELELDTPFWGTEVGMLLFATDLLGRAVVQDRLGEATANREGWLTDEAMTAIVDIDAHVDFDLAVEAAVRWQINPATSFRRFGAYGGLLDAATSLGVHERLQKAELSGLAGPGVRALVRLQDDDMFDRQFVQSCYRLRDRLPETLIDLAERENAALSRQQLLTLVLGPMREQE